MMRDDHQRYRCVVCAIAAHRPEHIGSKWASVPGSDHDRVGSVGSTADGNARITLDGDGSRVDTVEGGDEIVCCSFCGVLHVWCGRNTGVSERRTSGRHDRVVPGVDGLDVAKNIAVGNCPIDSCTRGERSVDADDDSLRVLHVSSGMSEVSTPVVCRNVRREQGLTSQVPPERAKGGRRRGVTPPGR